MRTQRALAAAAVTAAALSLAAPPAAAWTDPSNIVVSPSVVPVGGLLTVTVDGTACSMPRSAVSSRTFPTTAFRPDPGGNRSRATVRVREDAAPGSYDVTAGCGEGRTLTRPAGFTVIQGPVRAGAGGGRATGASATDMAMGGSLVGAALLGGAVFWIRRRAERTSRP